MVSTTSILIIDTSKEIGLTVAPNLRISTSNNSTLPLKCILCIHHQINFKKDQTKIRALLDFDNKVNIITLAYIAKPSFQIQSTNIKAQKIDGSNFQTFKMVLASF